MKAELKNNNVYLFMVGMMDVMHYVLSVSRDESLFTELDDKKLRAHINSMQNTLRRIDIREGNPELFALHQTVQELADNTSVSFYNKLEQLRNQLTITPKQSDALDGLHSIVSSLDDVEGDSEDDGSFSNYLSPEVKQFNSGYFIQLANKFIKDLALTAEQQVAAKKKIAKKPKVKRKVD